MQIQVQKEMQKESAKHADYKAKVPLRGVAVKNNLHSNGLSTVQKTISPASSAPVLDAIKYKRSHQENAYKQKKKATIKKNCKDGSKCTHKKSALALYAHFRAAGTFVTPPPCGASVDFPLTPPEFNAVQTPFTGAFEVAKKIFVNVFRQYLRRRTKQRIHTKQPSRNSPMP